MIQGDIEISREDCAVVFELMQNQAFVTIMTKILMVKEQQMLDMLTNYARQGNQHETTKIAGYLEALYEFMTTLRDIAKAHLHPPKAE